MRRIRLILEYEGTNYVGWQTQPNGTAVQAVLEEALHAVTGERAALHGSGAHADRNGVDAALAQHRQLGRMAVVEGIIFGDDADKIHTFPFRRLSAVQEAAPGGAFFPLYHSRASRLQTINKHKFFRHALCSLPEAGGKKINTPLSAQKTRPGKENFLEKRQNSYYNCFDRATGP